MFVHSFLSVGIIFHKLAPSVSAGGFPNWSQLEQIISGGIISLFLSLSSATFRVNANVKAEKWIHIGDKLERAQSGF